MFATAEDNSESMRVLEIYLKNLPWKRKYVDVRQFQLGFSSVCRRVSVSSIMVTASGIGTLVKRDVTLKFTRKSLGSMVRSEMS